MKMMKKLATLLLAICLAVPCFSLLTHAAEGAIRFTDPSTAVGETLEIMGVVRSESGLGNLEVEVTMSYDTTMLKFKSGDVEETQAGTLVYTGTTSTSDGDKKEFTMKFDVLKEGTTKLEIKDSEVKNSSGRVLDYIEGLSTVTIAAGNGTTTAPVTTADGATVEVNGVNYTISNEFPESEIPEGYEASTLDYDMVNYNVVYNEDFGLYLAYLVNEEMAGAFFMYVEEYAVFAPYEEIAITDTRRIAFLSDVSEIVLPDEYKATQIVIHDQEFPAWRDAENPDYCIFYAINDNGEKWLYQLDNEEGTYQRFIAPEVVVEEIDDSFIGKLSDVLEEHLDYVILGTGLGFLLFILIIIVLSVKLYNRNAELDEIYDEYGLDEEKDTEDDVILDMDEEDDDDYDDLEDEEDKDDEVQIELDLKEDMKEVFAEDTPGELGEIIANKASEQPKAKSDEESLGAVLEKQVAKSDKSKDEFFDDEEDVFENFSLDFIDLED